MGERYRARSLRGVFVEKVGHDPTQAHGIG
jgi:hypothetical protein